MTATPNLAITPYLLPGFDQPYITAKGVPHYGPVHIKLAGENLVEHELMQMKLEKESPIGGYIGFGGWINLGCIAALRPQASILADINPLQALYWQLHLNTVAACETKNDFTEQLLDIERDVNAFAKQIPDGLNGWCVQDKRSLAYSYGAFRDSLTTMDWYHCDGYGLSEESYASLRGQVLSGRIAVALVDVKDKAKIQLLRRQLEEKVEPHGRTIVHVSNLLDFISPNSQDWAGTPCSGNAVTEAWDHCRILAHGADLSEQGTIVHTRASVKHGVRCSHDEKYEFGHVGFTTNQPNLIKAKLPAETHWQGRKPLNFRL